MLSLSDDPTEELSGLCPEKVEDNEEVVLWNLWCLVLSVREFRYEHMMLGQNENLFRMRMKLAPNPGFENHEDAAAQRDNVKKTQASVSIENTLLDHHISAEAVNTKEEEEVLFDRGDHFNGTDEE